MLTATFRCFSGLGTSAEQRLWERGCLTWQAFERLQRPILSPAKTNSVRRQIAEARIALRAGLADWFLNRLDASAAARILPHFVDATAYLDIETTGLRPTDRITTIALFDGAEVRAYVAGCDLHHVLAELPRFRLLVTFNGNRFDLPVLRTHFGIDLRTPHLDLLPVLRQTGLKGGQKRIEKKLGITRTEPEAFNGEQAVQLWRQYEQGDDQALEKLVRYNAADAVNLARLAAHAYRRAMQQYPIAVPPLRIPTPKPRFVCNALAL